MKKAIYLVCVIALIAPFIVWAADGNDNHHRAPNGAVHKYIKEQVMPVLLQKRQQFDAELNSAEKAEIADCWALLKQLHSEHHDWKGEGAKGDSPDNEYYGQKHEANPRFEQHKAIMKRLQAIADKHSNSLEEIKTQLESAHIKWMNDIHSLQATETNDTKSAQEPQNQWHHGFGGIPIPSHHLAAHFLLLPANGKNEENEELKSDFIAPGVETNSTIGLTSFQLTPNPASNDIQIGNDALPASNTLKVMDIQGKEVMSLENVQAAQHINVGQLANGTYLVQIKSGDQSVTKKVVINK